MLSKLTISYIIIICVSTNDISFLGIEGCIFLARKKFIACKFTKEDKNSKMEFLERRENLDKELENEPTRPNFFIAL